MISYEVVDRKTGQHTTLNNSQVSLNGSKILVLNTARDNILSIEQNGNQLIIKLKSGESIVVNDFFTLYDGNKSELVINDQTNEGGGYWWIEQPETGSNWAQLDTLDPLMIQSSSDGIPSWAYWAGAGALLAGGIGAAAGGGGGSSHHAEANATPADPIILTNNANGITGTGTPGSEIVLTKPDGTTEIAVVGNDGNWSFTYNGNPLENGEEGKFVARDPNDHNNVSNEVISVADTEAPDAPIVNQNNEAGLGGTAESGSTITLTKPDGSTVTTVTDPEGNWNFAPNPLDNNTSGEVAATDKAGNESSATDTGLSDTEAPDAPIVNQNNASGIGGTAEAGSTVTLTKPDGTTVTTEANDTDGSWSFPAGTLENGAEGKFTATDEAGNTSGPTLSTANTEGPSDPTITENNEGGLSGTGDPNTEITLTKPDGSTVTTTTDENGNWGFEPNPLENDTSGTITSTDPNGNTSNEVDTGLSDTEVPDAPIVNQNNEAGLGGTAESGSTITLTKPDGSTVTTVTDPEGNWNFAPNPLDNNTSGEVTATDKAGNESSATDTGLSDTEAPDAPIVSQNNASGIGGTAEAGSTVTLTKPDGTTVTTEANDTDGSWSFPAGTLENGAEGKFTATDEAGNTSGPTLSTANTEGPSDPTITENNEGGLSGTGDPNTEITLTKPDGSTVTTTTDENGNWGFEPNPLENDTSGTITSTDPNGNTSNEVDTGLSDTEVPDAPIVNQNNEAGLGGTAESGSTITLTKPDGSTVTTVTDPEGNWNFAPNPLDNNTSGEVTATDKAGNESSATDTGLSDTEAPDAPIVSQNNASGIGGTAEAGSTITLTKPDGTTVTTEANDTDGSWSFPAGTLENGAEGKFTATDEAGNTSGPTLSTANTEGPSDPTITENNEGGLSGTGDPNTEITLTKPDGSTVTTTTDENGNWGFEPNPLENDTSGTITSTDPNGNTSNEVDTGLSDTEVPDAPIVSQNNASGIGGTAEAGSTVTLTKPDGTTVTTEANDTDGSWSFPAGTLENGAEGKFTATDEAGNTSGPTLSTANTEGPSDPTITENNEGGLSGTGDPNTEITLTKPDGSTVTTTTDENGNWGFEPNPLENDTSGTITSTDPNGNTSNEVDTGLSDTEVPDAPIVNQNNEAGLGGTAESGSTITLTKPDGSTVTTVTDPEGNWNFAPNPLDNNTSGEVTATDKAGNESSATDTGLSDTEAPDAPIVSQNNASGIGGTAEAGSTVTLTKPDGTTVTTEANDTDGSWSFPAGTLENGAEGKFTATDEAGNTSGPTLSTANTEGPSDPTITENNEGGLSGTGDPNTEITLTKPDGSTVTTTTDENGNWGFEPNPLENDTSGTITSTDPNGNTSNEVDTGLSDTEVPDAPIVNQNNEAGLGGTAESGSTITLTKPDGSTVTTVTDPEGNWNFAPNPLDNNTSGEVTATDKAGNESSATDTGLSDTEAPDAPIVSQNNASGIGGTAEAGSTITLTKPDGTTVTTEANDTDGSWSFPAGTLENGAEGKFTATDEAGNTSGPTLSTANTEGPSDPTITENNEGGLSGTGDPNTEITLTKPDGSTVTTTTDENGNWGFEPNPLENDTSGTITSTDPNGNTSNEVDTGLSDTEVPDAPIVSQNNASGIGGTAEAGSTVTLTKPDGTTVTTEANDTDGSWSFPAGTLENGAEGKFTATDEAGNTSGPTLSTANTEGPSDPTITENNEGGLSGTGDPNTEITLTKPDGSTVTTTTDENGNWGFEPNPLENDTSGTITSTDPNGNTSNEVDTGLSDTEVPDAPIVNQNNEAGLGGTAESGSTITLTKPDGSTVTTVTDPEGNWNFAPNPLDNNTSGEVTATDKAGNESSATDTGLSDTEAPDAPIVSQNNASGIGGTAEAGSTVTLTKPDGTTVTTEANDTDGSWSFPAGTLENGAEGKFTATDEAGNTSGPTLSTANTEGPSDPTITENNEGGLSGTGDPNTEITLTKPDGSTVTTTTDENGNWGFEPNPLENDTSGTITSTDPNGNTSNEVDTGLSDTEVPDAPIVNQNNEAGLGGTAESGSTITLTKPDGSTVTTVTDPEGNWNFAPNPLDNNTSGEVTATDKAGNESSATDTGLSDTEAPDAPIVSQNNASGIGGTAEAGSTITLTKPDGTTVTTEANDTDGSWSFPAGTLENGAEGKFTATDEAGNTSGPTLSTANTEGPSDPTITENNEGGLSGTGDPNTEITLTKPDGSTVTTTTDENGNWGFEPNPLENDTSGTITSTDPNGNTSNEVDTGLSDTEVPDAPIVSQNNASGIGGTAEAGSTVTLTKPDGTTVTTEANDTDGSWSFPAGTLENGAEGKFTATDEAGNTSGPTLSTANTEGPSDPTITENNEGGLSGTGDPNTEITLTKPDGSTVTTTTDENGNWGFEPNPLENDTSGTITSTDPNGNTSNEVDTGLSDTEVPDAPIVNQNNEAGLGGTAESGSTITLTKPDGSTVTTVTDPEGNWNFAPNPLDNNTSGEVTATDKAGNESSATDTGLSDTEAPDAPIVSQNNASGIGGTAEAGSTVTLTKPDGTTVTTEANDTDGSWSFPAGTLENGAEGKFTATDEAGNTSGPTLSTANTEGPSDPTITENNEGGLSGTGDPNTEITLTKPDGSTVTTTTDENGNWGFEPNPLENDTSGTITSTDPNGNTSNEVDTGLSDTEVPDAPIVNQNNEAGLGGTAESGSTITLTKPDGSTVTTVTDPEGNWNFAPNPLDNNTSGEVTATDKAGNESSATDTGLSDTEAPDAPIVNQNNASGIGGTAEAGSTVTLTKPDGTTVTTEANDTDGSWSFPAGTLENGAEGKFTATDEAGNTSGPTLSTANTEGPSDPTITENNEGGLSGTGDPNTEITLTKPDGSTVTTTTDENGNWGFEPNPLENDTSGTITSTDPNGNTSNEVDTGLSDTEVPDAPIVNQNNEAGLGGTAESGSTITLTKPDGSTVTTVTDPEGNWNFAPNPLDNNTSGEVTATDKAGNESSATDTGLSDTEAPDAPIVSQNNASGIGGTAEAGSTVTLTKPDGSTVTTVTDPEGNWNFAPNPLDNNTSGEVTATDKAGNESSATDTGLSDTEVPDAPIVNQNNEAGLGGTAESGSTITLTKPDGSTVTTVTDPEGNWNFAPNPLENDTSGTITSTDPNGNTSNEVDTGLSDTEAPDAPIVSQNNASGIGGTAEAGSTVTLTKPDGTTVTTEANDTDGSWSFPAGTLENGAEGKFTATDEAGNTSGPTLSTANTEGPSDPTITENNEGGLSGTGDPNTEITLTKPDGSTVTTTTDENGNWGFEPNPLENDTSGTITSTDPNGNTSNEVDTGLSDTEVPDAPIVNQNNEAGLGGTAESGSTITLTKPDGSTVTTVTDPEGNWNFAPNPLDNNTSGEVTATDKAGNESSATDTGLADTEAPDAPIVNQNNEAGLGGTAESGSTITLTKPDGSTVTTVTDPEGNWNFAPNPLDNNTSGEVTATDKAGNESSATDTGLSDTEVPDAPIVNQNNEAGLGGTAESGSTITLTKPDGSTVTTVTDPEGNWNFAPNPLDNNTSGEVAATDKAGNESSATDTGLSDTEAPDAPIVNQNNASGIGGTAEAGSTVTLTKPDGTTVTTEANDTDGSWSFPAGTLENGAEGKFTATDEAGNTSGPTLSTANTEGPSDPTITENNEGGLSGTGDPNTEITLTKPDGSTVTTTTDENGNWGFEPNPLENDTSGTITSTDPNGNTSNEVDTGLSDTEVPDAPIVNQNNEAGLGGTAESGSTITLTKPDGSTVTTVTDPEGNWNFAPNPLDNNTSGEVTATDKAGNESSATDTGLADTEAPDAPIVNQNNEAGLGGTAESGSTITLTKPDGSTVTTVTDPEGNWNFAPNPLDNNTSGEVTATDKAGNESSATDTGLSDTEVPDAPIVNQNNEAGLGGTAESGSTITLTKPDGSTVTTVTDPEGNWNFEPNPLDNNTSGEVAATDKAGNESSATDTGLADTEAPEAPVVNQNNASGIGGTAEPGSKVTLTKPDGTTVTTEASDTDGSWSFPAGTLENGAEGKFTATDEAGNTGEVSISTADTEAPEAPVVNQNNASGIGGTAEPGSTVTLTKPDGTTVTTEASDTDGSWSFPAGTLENGAEGKFTATDEVGNTSEVSINTADTEAPDAPIVSQNNASGIGGTAEPGSTVTLTKPDGTTVTTEASDTDGSWSFPAGTLENGAEGKFTATDEAGNTGEVSISTADTEAPEAPVVNQNNASGIGGTAEPGSTVTLTKPDGTTVTTEASDTDGSWSFPAGTLENGAEGKFTATDEAGNTGEVSISTADTEAPEAPVVNQNNASGIGGTAEPGSTVTLTKPDGTTVTTEANDTDGSWSFEPNPLENNTSGEVTATDKAGNESSETDTGLADTEVPDAPVITDVVDDALPNVGNVANNGYTNDKTPTINGTAEANSVVTIYNGSEVLGTTITDTNGNWTFTPSVELADGTYTLTAVATDPSGNTSLDSNDYIVILDTSVPNENNTISIDSITDDTGVSDNDFITNDNTLIFKGSLGEALQGNEQVVISLDGGVTWNVATVDGTQWSYDNTGSVLNDGSYDVEVRVTTKAGGYNDISAEQVVQVDTQAPVTDGLDTTFVITTDTSSGIVDGDQYSHSSTAVNNDLITRDQTVTISGVLTADLGTGNYLQISSDNGLTWTTVSVTDKAWSYTLPEFNASTTENYQLRVIDAAGNVATDTGFVSDGYDLVVDLDSPDGISLAPVVPDNANTETIYTYDSSVYGKVEAGATVTLVNDVNKDGRYNEGVDTIVGYAVADEDGNWSIKTKLPSGSSQLGFVVWDAAGNNSGLSTTASIGAQEGDGSKIYEEYTLNWGGTSTTAYGGSNASALGLQNGQWTFLQTASGYNTIRVFNMKDSVTDVMNTQYGSQTLNTAGSSVTQGGDFGINMSSTTFADLDRNGYDDIIGQKSATTSQANGNVNAPIWYQTSAGVYEVVAVDISTQIYQHLGGTIIFDRTGDGWLDVVMSNSEANYQNHPVAILENDGTGTLNLTTYTGIPGMSNTGDGNLQYSNYWNLTFLHEVSGVDLNNDGAVDIVGHSDISEQYDYTNGNLSRYLTVLYNNAGNANATTDFTEESFNNVFTNDGYIDYSDLVASMVWADFNGDGYLDLFIGRGAKNGANSTESRIYLNDGSGHLLATDGDALWFGDRVDGGTSIAVDWNHDGLMDVLEVPRQQVGGSAYVYLNTGNNVWNDPSQQIKIGDTTSGFSGGLTVDYDWDGAVDLVLYRAGAINSTAGNSILIRNTNSVADGTALHIRIVDAEGFNVFFGNTVNLYNSKGELVATQVINAQSSGFNDSTGLLHFYGLDPNETYSVQLLRVNDGVVDHIGSGNNYGGYTETTINSTWGNIKAGQANEGLVLTAENNGESHDTAGAGITGTGYNDTFFAAEGDRTYDGSGGWETSMTGSQVWKTEGGLDIVDYSLSTGGITADLSTGVASGFGNHTLINIEGLIGSKYDDVFTDNASNNTFEGGAGNDTFNLINGGNDTLLYKVLVDSDGTGGNGSDTVNGFTIGNIMTDANADLINIKDLLDYNGNVSFYLDEGEKKLDYNSKEILDYIKVEYNGTDTIISIDRDGSGDGHEFTELVTLKDTNTDLLTLLSNNQIVV